MERMSKRMTKGEAIAHFCWECMGYSWHEVSLCTATNCPLYQYRLGDGNKYLLVAAEEKTELEKTEDREKAKRTSKSRKN